MTSQTVVWSNFFKKMKPRISPLMYASHPFYACWNAIHYRCYDSRSSLYENYGGRGIKVSDSWHIFDNFHADMFASWVKGLEIDRRDNDGDYSVENCHWTTIKENTRNRRTTILSLEKAIEIRELAKIRSAAHIGRKYGVARTTISDIIHNRTWI